MKKSYFQLSPFILTFIFLFMACSDPASPVNKNGTDTNQSSTDTSEDPYDTTNVDTSNGENIDLDKIGLQTPIYKATGCSGVYNSSQVLDFYLEMEDSNWQTVIDDTTNSVWVTALMHCGSEAPITVAVRRKRSGSYYKPGLKIDINYYLSDQTYHHGLKKLSFENGTTGGTKPSEARTLLSEFLGWRLMVLSRARTGHAAFFNLHVNGELLGTYINVEQTDRAYLTRHALDDSGWLWKFSGAEVDIEDGQRTGGDSIDPYYDSFCFFNEESLCAPPSLATRREEIEAILDVNQLLTIGAVNAIIANMEAPIATYHNRIFYDYHGGKRLYFPWDLDTVMNEVYDVYMGQPKNATSIYTDVLFPTWSDDYHQIVSRLINTTFTLDIIKDQLEKAATMIESTASVELYLEGDVQTAKNELISWWEQRLEHVRSWVDSYESN